LVSYPVDLRADSADLAVDHTGLANRVLDLVEREQSRESFQSLGQRFMWTAEMKTNEARCRECIGVPVLGTNPILEVFLVVFTFIPIQSNVSQDLSPPDKHRSPSPVIRRENNVFHQVRQARYLHGIREQARALNCYSSGRLLSHRVPHEHNLETIRENYIPVGSRRRKWSTRSRHCDKVFSTGRRKGLFCEGWM